MTVSLAMVGFCGAGTITMVGQPPPAPVRAGHEVEVKFRTDAAGLQRALASPLLGAAATPPVQNLRSTYFDTAAGDLRQHGIVLRLRKKGRNGAVQGIKSASPTVQGPFRRREIEVQNPDLTPNLALFDPATAAELFRIVGNSPLQPEFETLVKRRTLKLQYEGTQIEVAFDEGCIALDGAELPLCEVELELKKGSEAALYDFALKFAGDLPLRLDFVSKSEKGFRAHAKETAVPVSGNRVALESTATLDEAVTEIISNTLAHFVANWAALRETDHPEAIHQMRVGLRRMRSAFSMFRQTLAPGDFELLGSEAKRIAAELGPARECDAFIKNAGLGPFADANHPTGCNALLEAVKAHRDATYAQARAVIEAPESTALVLRLQGFLAHKAWRDPTCDAEIPLVRPRKFARATLRKLHARVLKRGQGIGHISDDARHKLRIALKNLRYGLEFFGSLFDRQRALKAYVESVCQLQDLLGAHNDAVMAKKLLGELSGTFNAEAKAASGFMLGWYARSVPLADKELGKRWKKFKHRTPPLK